MSSLGREHSSFLSWWYRVPKFLSRPSSLFSLFLHPLFTFYIKNINRWIIVIFLFPVFLCFVISDVLFCWLLLLLLLFCFVFICFRMPPSFYWKLDLVYWARTEVNLLLEGWWLSYIAVPRPGFTSCFPCSWHQKLAYLLTSVCLCPQWFLGDPENFSEIQLRVSHLQLRSVCLVSIQWWGELGRSSLSFSHLISDSLGL